MRTTVEITNEQRAGLLKLAAQRGEKGFSKLIQEALSRYLGDIEGHQKRIKRAREVLGTLDADSAENLQASVNQLRTLWR